MNITYDPRAARSASAFAQTDVAHYATSARAMRAEWDKDFNESIDSGSDALESFIIRFRVELATGAAIGIAAILAVQFLGFG